VPMAASLVCAPVVYPLNLLSLVPFFRTISKMPLLMCSDPVFEGKFRIIQDVTIDFSPASDICPLVGFWGEDHLDQRRVEISGL